MAVIQESASNRSTQLNLHSQQVHYIMGRDIFGLILRRSDFEFVFLIPIISKRG